MQYRVTIRDTPGRVFSGSTTVVGCGGTGGFVAEGLCRLLPNEETLLLIDHDRVEPHNLRRQNFFEGDVGKFKSQVLAERLSRQYGRKVGYCTSPYTRHLLKGSELGGRFQTYAAQGLVVGCVDNAGARREIMESMRFGSWWLDAGNGRHSGQVLLGNALVASEMEKAFNPEDQTVHALPVPSLQAPDLLMPSELRREGATAPRPWMRTRALINRLWLCWSSNSCTGYWTTLSAGWERTSTSRQARCKRCRPSPRPSPRYSALRLSC